MTKGRDKDQVVSNDRSRDQLQLTVEVIRSLRKQVDFFREQNKVLLEERSALFRLRSRLDALRGDQREQETELDLLHSERDRLVDLIRSREKESQELASCCSMLELDLADERSKTAELREVIDCLEGQMEQLESMVHMLSEHEALRRTEERLVRHLPTSDAGGDPDPSKG
jgi:septal ring factor EnvC (AmiA/AmiB activator)